MPQALSVYIPTDLKDRIDAICQERGVTIRRFTERALEVYIAQHLDADRVMEPLP